jgi:tRNA uridine 5-carboxymethylaminomethyl modification enzyme
MTRRLVVIGGGHAGIEAAAAAARMGVPTVLVTMSIESIGRMSCNPAIGGVAKGNLAVEVDALGGLMGRAADAAGIQFRMLNRSRGPAVWGPRAQADRELYAQWMRRALFAVPNLEVRQGVATAVRVEGGTVTGVDLAGEERIDAAAVVVTAGTFMNGVIHIGANHYSGGRTNEPASVDLSDSLRTLGLRLERFKTGTPPRVLASSVDFTKLEIQHGDPDPVPFSMHTEGLRPHQVPCHITYTHPALHAVILENLHASPLVAGRITGTGPRYCPSLEVKVVRFGERERHQIFVEPEGLDHPELYLNGFSMSLPVSVQDRLVRLLPGFERAVVTRPAYAIEYDYADPTQLDPTLQVKGLEGLFLAGQVNGTSGYEEAAAQGLMAGINAARAFKGEGPVMLGRDRAYIGVMVDDLTSRGVDEPYRMFTSRAEYRLQLGFRSARRRLLPLGRELDLVPEPVFRRLWAEEEKIAGLAGELDGLPVIPTKETRDRLRDVHGIDLSEPATLGGLHRRLKTPLADLCRLLDIEREGEAQRWSRVEEEILYAPYRERQVAEVGRMEAFLQTGIPEGFDFAALPGVSREAQDKLAAARPATLAEAKRLPGVTPAALTALYVALRLHAPDAGR